MADLDDCSQWFGSDLQSSPTGDIARASNGLGSNALRSRERVLRRLLTNPGSYQSHPKYGAGISQHIGEVLNIKALTALIKGQMFLEASVSKIPAPIIDLQQTPTGVQVDISYLALPDKQPVALSFSVP